MSEAEREHQQRRAAAHEGAAEVHDQAAVNHEDAAAFFDDHDRPNQARRERDLADDEAARKTSEAEAEG